MALTVTTAELALMLGEPAIDEDRAALMIELAGDLCSTVVSPLPEEAKAVVLTVAARGYSNPQGVTMELIGPYQAQRPRAGIYLTAQERLLLRRMAGQGTAFSVSTMPDTARVPTRNPWNSARAEKFARDRGDI